MNIVDVYCLHKTKTFCFLTLTGSQESIEQSLINELLKGYNKDAHPIPEQNKSMYGVTFGLELVQLVNVVSTFWFQQCSNRRYNFIFDVVLINGSCFSLAT